MKQPNLIRTIFAGSLLLQLDFGKGKTVKCILLLTTLALGILGDTNAQAQPDGVPLWTNRYNGPANDADYATSMAVDTNGNVFVTGYSFGIGSSYDYATIKYSGAGVALWTNRYGGPGSSADYSRAMAVDGSGNVFVTGASVGTNGISDYATIKYSGAGVPLWTNRYNGPGNGDDYAVTMAVDGNGNVFVTGASLGTTNYLDYDYATIKYSGAGVALWTNRYNGPGNKADRAVAVAVDTNGNVFVTGTSASSNASYSYGYATIKYSGAGVALWTNRYDGPINGDQQASALAVDGSGNVFVTGYAFVSVYCDDGGCYYDYDYVTIKYSGAGVPLWTNRYNGPGGNGTDGANDRAWAMAVDATGNVFVTGSSDDGFGNYAYDTIKYSGAGVGLWINRYAGPYPNNYVTAVAVDGRGNVFVTGGSAPTNGIGLPDYATTKYSNAGVPLWTNRYNGSFGYNYATAIAVDRSGNVFVTGYSHGNGSGYDYATIKYSSTDLPSLNIVRTMTNAVGLSWPSPSTGFTLQQNTNSIATVNWSNVLTTPTDNGTTKTVIVNPATGNRFFRLKSQ